MQAAHGKICWLATLLIAGAALACAGCNPAAGLHGEWQLDPSQLQSNLSQSQRIPLGGALKLMSLAGTEMKLEFQADGAWSLAAGVLGNNATYPGQWRFVEKEGNTLVIMIQMEGDAQERELRVTLKDDDHLEMPLPVNVAGVGEQKIPFRRVTSE